MVSASSMEKGPIEPVFSIYSDRRMSRGRVRGKQGVFIQQNTKFYTIKTLIDAMHQFLAKSRCCQYVCIYCVYTFFKILFQVHHDTII